MIANGELLITLLLGLGAAVALIPGISVGIAPAMIVVALLLANAIWLGCVNLPSTSNSTLQSINSVVVKPLDDTHVSMLRRITVWLQQHSPMAFVRWLRADLLHVVTTAYIMLNAVTRIVVLFGSHWTGPYMK